MDCSQNFPYTPVFAYYKSTAKESPIVYRNEKFTPDLLEDFVKVCGDFKVNTNNNFLNDGEKRSQIL